MRTRSRRLRQRMVTYPPAQGENTLILVAKGSESTLAQINSAVTITTA